MNAANVRLIIYSVLLAVLSFLWFYPGASGGFLLDDGLNIQQNALLHVKKFSIDSFIEASLSFHYGSGMRALPMLSFALDYWRSGGLDVVAFKLTNILIHACTVVALVLFLRRLLQLSGWESQKAVTGAMLLAALWAFHPLQVSSVLYVVQRMQTMATLFVVLALLAYLAMRGAQLSGGRGRPQGILVVTFWLLALLSKEDAILLPAYTLVLELTVLRFRAGQQVVAKGLQQSYFFIVLVGTLAFAFYIVPNHWNWDAYPGRDFSTPERLLTQARVLIMYLGQIILPWPDRLPFLYDWYPISRGLWQPLTTLPALLAVLGLIVLAWCLRRKRPLFSCGVLLFFGGHFVTSNVVGLELVFEHRNHLPLLGALLALMDLIVLVADKGALGYRFLATVAACALLFCITAGGVQIFRWADDERLQRTLVELVPQSERAWSQYSNLFFRRYNREGNPQHLIKAIEITEQGLRYASSPILATNAVIFKSLLGTVQDGDWMRLNELLESSPAIQQTATSLLVLMGNARRGFPISKENVLGALEILDQKAPLQSRQALEVAVFAYKDEELRPASLSWFVRFAERADPESSALRQSIKELYDAGHAEWAEELRLISLRKGASS